MNYLRINEGNEEVKLYYEDYGTGTPVVFIHGWPLSQDMWEYQVTDLVQKGVRCITYDRRGFGKSSRPLKGYDYDTLADDLKALLDKLDLRDVTLVGFSMGGGEVARYFSRHGGQRISKVVLISSVTPFLLKMEDNPDGVDESVFADVLAGLQKDRAGFLETFGKQFFGFSLVNHPLSSALMNYYQGLQMAASPTATIECAKSWSHTDFRSDVTTITVPTLIIHGSSDKTVPIDASAHKTVQLITGSQLLIYDGAPHGLFYTNKDQLNEDLVNFIQESVGTRKNEPAYAL